MGIRLLGPLEVVDDGGRPIDIGGSQPRVILAMLVAADGKLVPAEALIDAIWDESPPASAAGTLQTYVSRLRRALAPIGGSIVHESAGYRLDLDRRAIDLSRFESLADDARSALAAGDTATARSLLIDAEQLWRGPALVEVRDRPRIAGIARRLDDRRLAALEERITADLALGRHGDLVPELAQLVSEHPLRERLWELLALARYRAGLQADALRAISEARATLVGALGVEPGSGLRSLEQAILAQDPALDPSVADPVVATARTGRPVTPGTQLDPTAEERLPMIGRDGELAVLTSALAEVAIGRSTIAVVQGEAGVGKTRLVEELTTVVAEDQGTVVWGRALEGDAAPAYWPWLNVLRTLRTAHPGRSSGTLDQLLDASAASEPSAADRAQLLDGVLQLLGQGTGEDRGPLVVILEDVQWADLESLALTTQVASGLSSARVLLVLTMRDGEDARRDQVVELLAAVSRRRSTRRLHLRGLEQSATGALLAQVAERAVDDGLVEVVHERSGGNPFFAIELQRLLAADGLTEASAVANVAVPSSVRDVVRQRLTRLPPATLELLRLAAVVGRDVDVELISVASGRPIDRCLDELDVARDHQLLVDAGPRAGLRFSHALVREVVADELSSLRRARTHLAVADAIAATGRADEQAEILAEHLWAAVPIGVGARAAEALDRAADVAIRRFAVGTAADLLERSLELRRCAGADSANAAAELDTLVKLVWALRAQGGYQRGLDHYSRGAELAHRLGRHQIELEMQWAEWAGHDTSCDFDRARPVAMRFREWAATSDDPVVKLAGHTAWAIQCWHDGDLTESAAAFALVADARAALALGPDDVSLAAELVVLSTAFGLYLDEQVGRLVDPDGSFAAAAAPVSGNFPSAIIWTFASTSAMSAGDLERVEQYCRRVLEAEAGETLGFWGSQARMYLGAAMTATGRASEGRQLFDAGHQAYVAAGMHTGTALMLAAAASAEVVAGDLERATAHLAAAHDELQRGERWPVPFVLLAEADIAEAAGAPKTSVVAIRREAEAIARAQGAVVAADRALAAIGDQRSIAPSVAIA